MNLNDLTPEQRAQRGALWRVELDTLPERLVAHVCERLALWAVPLSPEGLRLPQRPHECDLVHTTRDVLSYARTGSAGDWSDAGSALDALLAVSMVHDSALSEPRTPTDWVDSSELGAGLRSELAEVARAALARVGLEQGDPIPRVRLAALAGVSLSLIEKAIRLGELTPKPARGGRAARGDGGGRRALDVPPESARAWLAGRGVEGIDAGGFDVRAEAEARAELTAARERAKGRKP